MCRSLFGYTMLPHDSQLPRMQQIAILKHPLSGVIYINNDYTLSEPFVCVIQEKALNCARKGIIGMTETLLSTTIKQLRKEYHLTQQDLAYKSGVGLRFVRELEQGKPTVRVDKVNQVLELFNLQLGPVPIIRRTE